MGDVLLRRLLFFCAAFLIAGQAPAATVLVLQFHNTSQYPDLDWVGESVAETLMNELGAANEIVLDRASRAEGMRRLSVRPGAAFTKATLIRIGQTVDASYVCYGTYDANLPPDSSQLKDSSIQVTARFIDLRKMHEGPELSETGKLIDLSRLEEHLAWQLLKSLEPDSNAPVEQFLAPEKLTRLDAKESYVRGLLSSNREQQQKWFTQAITLDPHFVSPAFELGKLALEGKDYRKAIEWFQHIGPNDPRYAETRFKMGLSAYGAADYQGAVAYFREVMKTVPLNEVYNNLGAAENRLNQAVAIDDFRRAVDGDQNDPTYLFNLGVALLKNNYFEEATKRLEAVLEHNPDDNEARGLLDRARSRQFTPSNNNDIAVERLKVNFDETAFRQLKAMLQPKGNP